ncbi:hypothetical protein KBY25_17190 [Ruegeria pomeroyi]|nr:hypothetical protein [Ruegeria pomeroyi]
MTYKGECSRRGRVGLALVMIWLSGCAAGGFDSGGFRLCPPVVEYTREEQVRAAEELALLPEGSAVVEMISDYAVMREQARGCA